VQKISLQNLPVKGKKVLMRVDFNVPLNEKGHITDDTRIEATLPSILYVLERGGSLILMSHLGRPKDKRVPELSLKPCAKRLSELLGREVLMAPDCVGPEVEKMAKGLKAGQILLLENLRFHRGEEHPEEDSQFVKQLASLGDVYVNDAFGTAHRAHASTAVIAQFFSGKAAAGLLLEKEIRFLGEALANPKRPFYAIIGGSKISTKCGVIEVLLQKADAVLIGGGMAYTFLKAQGIEIGDSIHEDDFLDKARDILKMSMKKGSRLLLPSDIVIADKIKEGAAKHIIESHKGIPKGFQGVDIGPQTIQNYANELRKAATILWNGPLGVFEVPEFARGTNAIAHILTQLKATTIVGGGDSIAAIQAAGVADKISHLSTGGGASLEYIEYGTLPGIEALSEAILTPVK
jgi:phosphoglycerate kinase